MSEPSAAVVSARCFCGAAAVRCEAAAKGVVHCHCGECRRLSGAAFTTWVSLPREAVHLSGTDSLVAFNATPNLTRHFCKVCGSHVFTADRRYPKILGVPAGIIDGRLPAEPTAHYFVSHKAAWHVIGDQRPQFGGESGVEPLANG